MSKALDLLLMQQSNQFKDKPYSQSPAAENPYTALITHSKNYITKHPADIDVLIDTINMIADYSSSDKVGLKELLAIKQLDLTLTSGHMHKTISDYRHLEKMAALEASGSAAYSVSSTEVSYVPDGIHAPKTPANTEPSASQRLADTQPPAIQIVAPILQQTDNAFRHNSHYNNLNQPAIEY